MVIAVNRHKKIMREVVQMAPRSEVGGIGLCVTVRTLK